MADGSTVMIRRVIGWPLGKPDSMCVLAKIWPDTEAGTAFLTDAATEPTEAARIGPADHILWKREL